MKPEHFTDQINQTKRALMQVIGDQSPEVAMAALSITTAALLSGMAEEKRVPVDGLISEFGRMIGYWVKELG